MSEKSFGTIIATLRKEKGMTQLDLARKMGVTDKAVSKWERDLSFPDVSSLPRLAEELGITVDELLEQGRRDPSTSRRRRGPGLSSNSSSRPSRSPWGWASRRSPSWTR